MTSTDSNQRAALAANAMASTAPSAKFGATSTPTPGRSARWSRTRASDSSVQPVVPTTTWMPASTSACTLPSVTAGIVKSIATCAPPRPAREVVARVDRGHELEVRGPFDGADDGLSHAARRAQHGHPDAFAHG